MHRVRGRQAFDGDKGEYITAFDGDKGEYITAWVNLADVLMSVSRDVVSAKLQSFRDGLARALETALLEPAPAPAPAASPVAASPEAPA